MTGIRGSATTAAAMAMAALLSGCATGPAPAAAAGSDLSIERGRTVAQIHCAACHAIGASGASPSPMAPPFRAIRMRYNEITFERRMARVGEDSHSEMPNFTLDRADVDDVAAYMDSLGGR